LQQQRIVICITPPMAINEEDARAAARRNLGFC
jgi:hypothetical protein